MRKPLGGAMIALLLLTGCGADTTPEGLQEALDDAGVGLDQGVSPARYYDAVQGVCDSDGLDLAKHSTRFGIASEAGNSEAFERMLAGMNYMCPDQGKALDQLVQAG